MISLIKRLKQTYKLLYPIQVFMDFLISLLKKRQVRIYNNKKKLRNRQFNLQCQLLSQHINTNNHFHLLNAFSIFFNVKMELTFSVYSIKYSQTTDKLSFRAKTGIFSDPKKLSTMMIY